MQLKAAVLFAGALAACSSTEEMDSGLPPSDGGFADSGARDTGPADLGVDATVMDVGFIDADPIDAQPIDAEPIDAELIDATPSDSGPGDAGCTASGAEVCDEVDNDCDGLVDNVDVAGDGITDCFRIALFGNAGAFGSSNFQAWLQANGVTVDRIQTDSATLTPALLAQYDVVIIDHLIRAYAPAEAELLRDWVEGGGGVMAMTGYTGSNDRLYPNQLMAELGVEYLPGLLSGPVTMFLPHAITSSITSITFSGGYAIGELPAAASSTTTAIASLVAGPVGIAIERGQGRAFVWGDEWITFDSEWVTLPEIRIFWSNIFAWLIHFR